ncbi:MAG: hypothetical protein Wins2KO_23790 [Winogradskyella sp.]
MKKFGVILFLLITICACSNNNNNYHNPYQLLPKEVNTLIRINELNDFLNSSEHHYVFKNINNNNLDKINVLLKHLNTSSKVDVGFDTNSSDYILLTKYDSTLLHLDTLKNVISSTFEKSNITQTEIDSTLFYHKTIGDIFVGSNNINWIENLNNRDCNKSLYQLAQTTSDKSVASIIFESNDNAYSDLLLIEQEDSLNFGKFSMIDLILEENSLRYSGLISSLDSIQFKLDCFKNTIPQPNSSLKVIPASSKNVMSLTFDDYSVFNQNRSQLFRTATDNTPTFLNYCNEITLADNAVMAHALDINLVIESIENSTFEKTHRDIDIFGLGKTNILTDRFQPFFSFENANFYFIHEDYIIFSNAIDTLERIISDILNNYVLAETADFKNSSSLLSDESSIFIYKNDESLSDIMNIDFKGYNTNIVQYSYENNYAHINGIIQKSKQTVKTNSVVEKFSTELDAEIIAGPQTVKNHVTKGHDILVQDVNNVLYLISNSGNTLWKKQLQGKIQGKVEQIDTYKNGRLQLVFATDYEVYVLDRNGNDVGKFPMKFKDEVTQPLSVFDYDKTKTYRLLVAQGKNLLMYDAKGKAVNGFGYKQDSNITSQPKHFRIGSKDYIVFTTEKKLKILNRQGRIRVAVDEKIQFSGNEIFLYKNLFTTTNTLGELIQVNTKGTITRKNLNLRENHDITSTSKTLVSLDENTLNIKSRSINLDYGDYTKPRIFYLNDKIYITTSDLQTKKVYLFDSQAQKIPNFPIFGSSSAELQKLDNNRSLELITLADNKTVIVYSLN